MTENTAETDLLIIGGGISGIGIAWEAGLRGIRTLVAERRTISGATSANSMRIVHGGLRYLQTLDFPRMIESVQEQDFLLSEFPEQIEPLECLMPLDRCGLRSRFVVGHGVRVFNFITNIIGIDPKTSRPSFLSSQQADGAVPQLVEFFGSGALRWFDARVKDPALFAQKLLQRCKERGAEFLEQAEVVDLTRERGRFRAVINFSGATQHIFAKAVVNATGPWLGRGIRVPTKPCFSPRWCKAFNLVVRPQLHPTIAVSGKSPEGRLYFVTPRGKGSVIGTFYLPVLESPDTVSVSQSELRAAIASINQMFTGYSVAEDDIESLDLGVLPMRRVGKRGPELFGIDRVKVDEGYAEVLSTKYTTFRSQARKVVDLVERWAKKD